jgi:hypothetical protein
MEEPTQFKVSSTCLDSWSENVLNSFPQGLRLGEGSLVHRSERKRIPAGHNFGGSEHGGPQTNYAKWGLFKRESNKAMVWGPQDFPSF